MPQFVVTGTSTKGRKTRRSIAAQTIGGARRKAERVGISVQNVEQLQPEPATDRQLSYARSLGITIPAAPSMDQMSDCISRAVEPPASDWLVRRAQALQADLDPERYFGVEYLSRQVNEVIGINTPDFVRERAFWYLHGVVRHQRRGTWLSPDESGVADDCMWPVVKAFVADGAALRSMQRDCPDGSLYQYAEFGDGYGGTLSIRTAAYTRARELLKAAQIL